MYQTRAQRMLMLTRKDQTRLDELNSLKSYESTKGTTQKEQAQLLTITQSNLPEHSDFAPFLSSVSDHEICPKNRKEFVTLLSSGCTSDAAKYVTGTELDATTSTEPPILSEVPAIPEENIMLDEDFSREKSLSPLFSDDSRDFDKDYYPSAESSDSENDTVLNTKEKTLTNCTEKSKAFTKTVAHQNEGAHSDVPLNIETIDNSATKNKKNQNFCYYCESLVKDFARHVFRNHSQEILVQQIICTPKGPQRNQLLKDLRNKGNFINASVGNIKPMRKTNEPVSPTKLRVCPFCKGYFVKRQLWRHTKKCNKNDGKPPTDYTNNCFLKLLSKEERNKSELINKVFSRMQDNIPNTTARKDPLICAYGSKYLKTHKQKHQATACSRRMRELAFIVIECKKIDPSITTLTQALQTNNFDNLMEAVKRAAGFNRDDETYRDASYAINIGTSLKECCELVILNCIKKTHTSEGPKYEDLQKQMNTTISLIKSLEWRSEITHGAINFRTSKKMNSVSIRPLATDIKLLREYLGKEGEKAAAQLKDNSTDEKAFRTLVETSYCRVLLLCRKRPGEVQRITTEAYKENSNSDTYEEFEKSITPTESILMKRFKRLVVKGKRKATPVLFASDVQEHISIIMDTKKNFVNDSNIYLFPLPKTDSPILGYRLLGKYAKEAGCKKPIAMTTRRLRKHLATICQILQMTDGDIEQLSTFMGHSTLTHRENYRLPDDLYQTSKITKLLMMMERGEGANFKGKSLNEIDVPLDDVLEDNDTGDESDDDNDTQFNDDPLNESIFKSASTTTVAQKSNLKKRKERAENHRWTPEQRSAVCNFFKEEIKLKTAPKKGRVMEIYEKYPTLQLPQQWDKIKVFVQNVYTKKQKQI